MADIFSLTEILIVIFFIVPGFVSLSIIRHIGLFENELTDKELIIWSILFSLVIYSIFALKFGISNFDSLPQSVFGWEQTVWIIGLAVGLGFGVGGFIRHTFRRGTHRGKIWDYIVKHIPDLEKYPKVRIVLEKQEYEGILFFWGKDFTPRDILILNPYLITMKNGKEEKILQSKELFVPESSIVSIHFLDNVTYHP